MEKKTIFALIAVLVLGVGAFMVMRAPEKGQRVGPAARPIPAIKASDVARIETLSEKQEKVVLEKKGDKWRVSTPGDWPADATATKQLLDGLEKLGFANLVTEGVEKHADLQVADGKAQRVTVKNAAGAALADFYVGKSVSGFTMIRPAGKNEVWQGTGFPSYLANREPKMWRDHTIFEFPFADADKLTVESGANKLALEKLAEKDAKNEPKWKILEATGDAPKTAEALDGAQANQALQALGGLRANDFADDKKAEDTGLAKPFLTITAGLKGKSYTLQVGTASADDIYVKTSDAPQIYTVKKFAFERLSHKPVDYRDKTLVKAKDADLASIEITDAGQTTTLEHTGDKWKGKNVDDAKAKLVAGGFENLQASSFSDEKEPAKTGLNKPTGLVTLRLKDKSTVALKIGAVTKDNLEYYVQKVGSPDVMMVKKFAVDRFLKKPSDLTAAPAAPAKAPAKKK